MKALKKKTLIIIAIGVAVIAAAVIFFVMLTSNESYRLIKVFDISGNAVIERKNVGAMNAYSGMSLENGDVVSVDDDSLMRLVLDSDKYILIEGGTKLTLEATGTADNSRTIITLTKD